MATKVYSFVEQLEKGLEGEKVLDEYFSQWYDIRHATIDEQKNDKIDRVFRRKGQPDGTPILVEYKTDDRTDKTGNLFIETWSAVEWRRYGWAFASKADIVVYYALPDTIYMLDTKQLREHLLHWMQEYPPKNIRNKGYTTQGLAIPTEVIVDMIGKSRVRRLP